MLLVRVDSTAQDSRVAVQIVDDIGPLVRKLYCIAYDYAAVFDYCFTMSDCGSGLIMTST